MNDGFFRVKAKDAVVKPGDVEFNKNQIFEEIDKAAEEGVQLLVLPELCVTSASCGDLYRQSTLLYAAEKAAIDIALYTEGKNIAVCYSFPVRESGSLYIVAALAVNGTIENVTPKYSIPSSQKRWFQSGEDISCIHMDGCCYELSCGAVNTCMEYPALSVDICFGDDIAGYKSAASIVACPAASGELIGNEAKRINYVTGSSSMNVCGYVYASAGEGESTTSCVYGSHTIIAENGYVLAESKPFTTGECIADIDLELIEKRRTDSGMDFAKEDEMDLPLIPVNNDSVLRHISKTPFVNEDDKKAREACRLALEIQARGLSARLIRTGIKKVVIGVSGGLDSTMALLAAVKTFDMLGRDRKDIIAITMPCFGTSSRTKSNAEKMSELLGADFRTVDISESVKRHLQDIGHDLETADTTYENAQARERTQVLMDVSNMENGLVLGTGDLSEGALGWCTFNGDHISMYNVNCDLPKTFLRAAVYYYGDECGNDALKPVLHDVVDTPISPELKPTQNGEIAQKTEDIIGPYEAHDFFLYHFIRNGSGVKKILRLAVQAFEGVYTEEQLKTWIKTFFRRFFSSQFKRNCSPDGPAMGSVNLASLGGWEMVSDISAIQFLKELDQ